MEQTKTFASGYVDTIRSIQFIEESSGACRRYRDGNHRVGDVPDGIEFFLCERSLPHLGSGIVYVQNLAGQEVANFGVQK